MLGEIEDLVIDNGKTITSVVVSVGGFLGMGESYVVLDPSTVGLNQKDGKWRAFVDTSKDNLKNAPKFKYTKAQELSPNISRAHWRGKTRQWANVFGRAARQSGSIVHPNETDHMGVAARCCHFWTWPPFS